MTCLVVDHLLVRVDLLRYQYVPVFEGNKVKSILQIWPFYSIFFFKNLEENYFWVFIISIYLNIPRYIVIYMFVCIYFFSSIFKTKVIKWINR